MIEENCKCKYSISPKVTSFVVCHFSFLISHKSYELTEKIFF